LPKTGAFSGYSFHFVAEDCLEVYTNEIILPMYTDEECRLSRCGVVWAITEPKCGGMRRLNLQRGKKERGFIMDHGFLLHMKCNIDLYPKIPNCRVTNL
jgi:hypothetical protein